MCQLPEALEHDRQGILDRHVEYWECGIETSIKRLSYAMRKKAGVIVVGASLSSTILLEVGCFAWVGDDPHHPEGKLHSSNTSLSLPCSGHEVVRIHVT